MARAGRRDVNAGNLAGRNAAPIGDAVPAERVEHDSLAVSADVVELAMDHLPVCEDEHVPIVLVRRVVRVWKLAQLGGGRITWLERDDRDLGRWIVAAIQRDAATGASRFDDQRLERLRSSGRGRSRGENDGSE